MLVTTYRAKLKVDTKMHKGQDWERVKVFKLPYCLMIEKCVKRPILMYLREGGNRDGGMGSQQWIIVWI